MKSYFNILFIFICLINYAQQSISTGEVFVTNNFKNETGLVVKWISNRIYFPKGSDVYRKSEGSSEWIKLNNTPIEFIKNNPNPGLLDNEESEYHKLVSSKSYDEFINDFSRIFVVIKAIYNPHMAKLLGITYYDKTAVFGETYQYKVIGHLTDQDIEVGVSESFTCEKYEKISPPDSINIIRYKDHCEIFWKPDMYRYYGVDIYRKSNDSIFELITKTPRTLQKTKDKKGNFHYPKVNFIDETINPKNNYKYKFVAIDYFGQKSYESEEISVPFIDFDPPSAPFGLIPTNHDSKLTVDLKWNAVEEIDLAGFNIYRSQVTEGPYIKVNKELLPKEQRVFVDKVPSPGHYYYYCSSIDFSGNETKSGKIYIQIRDMEPPSPPVGLTTESNPGSILLKWEPNSEKDLQGYFVQRSLNDDNNADNHFINMNTQPIDTSFFEQKLSKNVRNKFVYRIVAVDTSFNLSKPSINSLAQMPDVIPPHSPVIKTVNFSDDNLIIEWIPNVETDLLGYNLYRKLKSDTTYNKVNSYLIPSNLNSYTDRSTNQGEKYHYALKALDNNQNASSFSKPFYAENPKKKETTKIKFETAKLNTRKKQIQLVWNLQNSEIPIQGYVVFKEDQNNVFLPYVKLSKNNTLFEKVSPGIYKYQIRAYTLEGLVIKSDIKEFKLLKEN
tara:strand:- start:712 stop:2721 length:2010 start_codon:yes stop_codon:yes gene_type:complete